MTHQTINCPVQIQRKVYWSSQTGMVAPADRWLAISEHRYSPGLREMVCRLSLGRLLRREAARLNLSQAAHTYSVTDGAVWILHQCRQQLPMLDENILDYYLFRDHVIHTSHLLYGEGAEEAVSWCKAMMTIVWEQGSLVFLDRLSDRYKTLRSKTNALLPVWR